MSDLVGHLSHIAEHCGLSDADRRCMREAAAAIADLRARLDVIEDVVSENVSNSDTYEKLMAAIFGRPHPPAEEMK
jgi:hypothetical protein